MEHGRKICLYLWRAKEIKYLRGILEVQGLLTQANQDDKNCAQKYLLEKISNELFHRETIFENANIQWLRRIWHKEKDC